MTQAPLQQEQDCEEGLPRAPPHHHPRDTVVLSFLFTSFGSIEYFLFLWIEHSCVCCYLSSRRTSAHVPTRRDHHPARDENHLQPPSGPLGTLPGRDPTEVAPDCYRRNHFRCGISRSRTNVTSLDAESVGFIHTVRVAGFSAIHRAQNFPS